MNILDYLGTEFASFEEKPFNPVDSAALSQFCMVRAEGIVPPLRERKAFGRLGTIVKNLLSPSGRPAHFLDTLRAEHYEHMFSGLIPGRVKENMLALAASPRFRDMVIRDYLSLFDTERQTQFAAMTFVYKKEFAYVGFRGTDTSITGWRENFNMCYTAPVPAQEQAARYLEAVAPHLPRRLFVGGHSKGANLALYAALNASAAVQDRIERVYTHDGPGFKAGAFSPDDWRKLDGRIHRTVPQDSVIGMLMESHTPPLVVHSTERGLLQHSPFSCEVDGDDFVYLDNLTENARFTDALLTEWLARYSDEEAAAIVDALFKAVEASGAQNATEVFLERGLLRLHRAASHVRGAHQALCRSHTHQQQRGARNARANAQHQAGIVRAEAVEQEPIHRNAQRAYQRCADAHVREQRAVILRSERAAHQQRHVHRHHRRKHAEQGGRHHDHPHVAVRG